MSSVVVSMAMAYGSGISCYHGKENVLLWAACGLVFFEFLRCGELEYDIDTHLSIDDIALDSTSSPALIKVTIIRSKTDPFRDASLFSIEGF